MPTSAPETTPISKASLSGNPLPPPRNRPPRAVANRARSDSDFKDPRWQLVLRIAESRSLGKSPRLAEFLRYVCDRQIRGKDDEITEQQIGVKVFGRTEGYNSNDDNIVRSYARMLRKRLEDYFRKEGCGEPLILSIPRGGYIPVFARRDQVPATFEPDFHPVSDAVHEAAIPALTTLSIPTPAAPFAANDHPETPILETAAPPIRPRQNWPLSVVAILLATVAAFCGYFAGQTRNPWPPFQAHPARVSHQFWSTLFDQHRDTFVVPADGGLVMMQSFTRAKVNLPDYVTGIYHSPEDIGRAMQGFVTVNPDDQKKLTNKVAVLASRRYTSIVDLGISSRISQLREVVPERLVVRFARDLHIDDLHAANAILIGSNDANPWVALFEPQLNFQFTPGLEYGGSGAIVNTHPLPNEATFFRSITGDPANRTYGLIAYVPNLENNGHVLLIEGVNMAGTQAAGDFLFSPEQMQPMLDRARDSQGNLEPFEILLETSSIGSAASRSRVLSERVHPLAPSKSP
jgi:hypothetical protein